MEAQMEMQEAPFIKSIRQPILQRIQARNNKSARESSHLSRVLKVVLWLAASLNDLFLRTALPDDLPPPVRYASLWDAATTWSVPRAMTLLGFWFKALLCVLDFWTDVYNGVHLLRAGHGWWGNLTILFTLLPFLVHTVCLSHSLRSGSEEKRITFLKYVCSLFVQLPVFNTIGFIGFGMLLFSMRKDETCNNRYFQLIEEVLIGVTVSEALNQGAPQFVLQSHIVFRLGYITTPQLVSMSVTWIGLSLNACTVYYITRSRISGLGGINNPKLKEHLLPVLPCYMTLCLIYTTSWGLIFSYLGAYAFLPIAISACLIAVGTQSIVFGHHGRESGLIRNASEAWSCLIFGSVVSLYGPCITLTYRSKMLFQSCLISTLSLMMTLVGMIPAINFDNYKYIGFQAPIFNCVDGSDLVPAENFGQICLCYMNSSTHAVFNCGQAWIRLCTMDSCLPSVRVCEEKEYETRLMSTVVLPVLCLLLLGSLACIYLLQWLVKPVHFFLYTNVAYCGRGTLPLPLILKLMEQNKFQAIEDLLEKRRNVDLVIKTVHIGGDSCLHLACQTGHSQVVKCLLVNGGNALYENSYGQIPLQLAMQQGHKDCVKVLTEQSTWAESLDHRDAVGLTPVLETVLRGDLGMLHYLVTFLDAVPANFIREVVSWCAELKKDVSEGSDDIREEIFGEDVQQCLKFLRAHT